VVGVEDPRDPEGDEFRLVEVDKVSAGAGNEVRSPAALRGQFPLQRHP
jgi:hypothetical protein